MGNPEVELEDHKKSVINECGSDDTPEDIAWAIASDDRILDALDGKLPDDLGRFILSAKWYDKKYQKLPDFWWDWFTPQEKAWEQIHECMKLAIPSLIRQIEQILQNDSIHSTQNRLITHEIDGLLTKRYGRHG